MAVMGSVFSIWRPKTADDKAVLTGRDGFYMLTAPDYGPLYDRTVIRDTM